MSEPITFTPGEVYLFVATIAALIRDEIKRGVPPDQATDEIMEAVISAFVNLGVSPTGASAAMSNRKIAMA